MYQHFSSIVLRVPIHSLDKILSHSNIKSPIFQEAIFLSSKEVWNKYLNKNNLNDKDKIKLEQTILKYWIRSCTRCTPFATFAGCELASISDKTELVLEDSNDHYRHIRVDMNYLSLVIEEVSSLPEIRQQLKFYPNNSLYNIPNEYRYAEFTIINEFKNYRLNTVDKNNILDEILIAAQNGATISELTNLTINLTGASVGEVVNYLESLIQGQLLICELEPSITGEEPLTNLIKQLACLTGAEKIINTLEDIRSLIQNKKGDINRYLNIENELKKICNKSGKDVLQIDLSLSAAKLQVDKKIVDCIIEQTSDLFVFARKNVNNDLENFKNKFIEKYEDAEVSLTVALDADIGIGYASLNNDAIGTSDLINNLQLTTPKVEEVNFNFDYYQHYILNKYRDYIVNNKKYIEIKKDELIKFKSKVEKFSFSSSAYLIGSLFKDKDKFDVDNFIFNLKGIGGPSAANLLGRFTHNNKKNFDLVNEIIIAEENEYPDVIYAEIVHLPQERLGNIVLRPVLRRYEIPYIGKSGLTGDHLIPIEDIMVRIQNAEIVLRSKKHLKQIFPRLTTAHAYGSQNNLPIYRFLCDLQTQGLHEPLIWDWSFLESFKHLPRVIYKNLIIKKAQWRIDEKDIKDCPVEYSELDKYIRLLRTKYDMPERVVFKEDENELLIDFDCKEHIDLFLYYVKKYKKILLEEFLFTQNNSVVTDISNAKYANEIVIPLQKKINRKALKELKILSQIDTQRKFIPNTEWLYFKIYCGVKSGEKILREVISPYVEMGIQTLSFEKFFFVRYNDEFPHIRIRFYNKDPLKQISIQKSFLEVLQPFVTDKLVDKILIDTYNRELERYHPCLIEETESLFFIDSLAVLRLLNLSENRDIDKYRLYCALRSIDIMLDDFSLDLNSKKKLIQNMQQSYFNEFGASIELQKQLNEQYRTYQKNIFLYLNAKNDIKNNFYEVVSILKNRSKQNVQTINSLLKKISDFNNEDFLFTLLPSYIHMFVNRMFMTQQRKYELIIYHFLQKYYASQIAIEKVQITNL